MHNSLFCLTAAAFFTIVNASETFAQRHEIPTLNSCIREFYDPGMYNWLTYKNNCSQALTIVFVAKDGSGAGGTMDLRPGGSDSVGTLEGGVVPQVGSLDLYVCPLGYIPVDKNNKVVTKPHTTFQCRPKAQ